MRAFAIALLVAACHRDAPVLSAEERGTAVSAAKQCTDAVDNLAPSYQVIGPRLSEALKMNRDEARRLMRDSVELQISTREMLCNASIAVVEPTLAKAPRDKDVVDANARMHAATAKLAAVRAAYDKLLGAASSADAPVDQDALLQRFSSALTGR